MRAAAILRAALKFGSLMIFGLVLLAVAACSDQSVSSSNVAPDVGQRAPSFQAHFVGGGTAKLGDLVGNGVVLNFWATWCGPCRHELPLLDRVSRTHAKDGITVLAVNMGEQQKDVVDFLRGYNLTFHIALDTDGSISRHYAVPALPMTFFIDRKGVVRYRRVGELSESDVNEGLSMLSKPH